MKRILVHRSIHYQRVIILLRIISWKIDRVSENERISRLIACSSSFIRSFVKNSNQNSSHCRVNHQFDYVDYCSISISVSYFEWTHRNMHMCHFRSSPSVSLFDQIDWGKRRRGFCYCRRDSHLFLRQIQTHLSRLDDDQCMEENYPLDSRYTFVSYSFIIHCIDEQCTYFLQERETF